MNQLVCTHSDPRATDHLDHGEGNGALLLVLQQLFKEEFQQEGKGEDNPVPAERRMGSHIRLSSIAGTGLPSKERTTSTCKKEEGVT